jgi:hypothetical protein
LCIQFFGHLLRRVADKVDFCQVRVQASEYINNDRIDIGLTVLVRLDQVLVVALRIS